ncbi:MULTISPECIES: hypothetical protein [unclassified Corynebacterium]|uniref:hypothetical protein n=1 Tax=unclassified Corynebacterium TaxID=2624378 RepID=UPI0029CA0794|nr:MULTISPECIES: hypothetical protein [unclassified Corynebacterium]WPF65577.1 hypothetical protein OLX12_08335 [Corynebacterium sp. 22KM0430]WPF68072.1 hypothetical protein OLW90_08325 [Corynebacterium sp. 21KM1197]
MSPTRIHGFDLARALAIIGMMTSHLGPSQDWVGALSNGFPSALFAVLAGVSLSLMHAKADATGGPELAATRHRTLIRGVILVALGMVLSSVQSVIAVVLASIGAIYLVLGPCTRWRTRYLVAGAVILPLVGIGLSFYQVQGTPMAQSPLLEGAYPIINWLAYGIFGMVLHRAFFAKPLIPVAVTCLGLLVGGYAVWQRHLTGEMGHGENPLDVVYSYGFSAGVIGLCLLITRPRALTTALYPLRSLGVMALTVYVAHVLTAAIPLQGYPSFGSESSSAAAYGESMDELFAGVDFEQFREDIAATENWEEYMAVESETLFPAAGSGAAGSDSDALPTEQDHTAWWLGSIGVALVLCSLWRAFRPRGPLEAALRWATYRGSTPELAAR